MKDGMNEIAHVFRIILACSILPLFAAGCVEQGVKSTDEVLSGYTCCNLHYEKDRINDGNYAQLPLVPAGSPIRVINFARYRANVEINGKPLTGLLPCYIPSLPRVTDNSEKNSFLKYRKTGIKARGC